MEKLFTLSGKLLMLHKGDLDGPPPLPTHLHIDRHSIDAEVEALPCANKRWRGSTASVPAAVEAPSGETRVEMTIGSRAQSF